MILRGVKTIEYRSRPTKMIGQRFYIYAAKGKAMGNRHPQNMAFGGVPDAESLMPDAQCLMPALQSPETLPRGVIVGSAVFTHCTKNCEGYEWRLSDVKRYKRQRKVKRQPQPVWFRPF